MAFKVGVGEAFESDPVSAGLHDAVVAEVYDLGRRHSQFRGGEIVHQGIFVLQVDEDRSDGQFKGQPKELWQFFNVRAGVGPKTTLKRFLEGWRGRPFNSDDLLKIERQGLDLEELCTGKPLQVVVTHSITDAGKTRAKIEAALPPNKDPLLRLTVRDYTPLDRRESLDLNAVFGRPAVDTPVGVSHDEPTEYVEQEQYEDPLPF